MRLRPDPMLVEEVLTFLSFIDGDTIDKATTAMQWDFPTHTLQNQFDKK